MRYLVAMSGGVDSSAAAYLLLKQGHCVEGAIMRLSPFSDGSDVRSAEAVCRELGINLRVLDLRAEFERYVIGPFCDQYLRCRTPNPCVFCNNKLKFGAFLDYALAEGFDGMATGHYAAITERNGRYAVSVAACAEKDQSYFLWDLDQRALSKTVFPLCGAGSKDEVRRLVKDAGLPVYSRGDSQDICFVPDGEYGDFIREHTGAHQPEGDFVDEDGKVLGRHKGLLNYTIGQRRYLNVAAGRRIFVIGKDAEKNTVTLGDGDRLYTTHVRAEGVRLQLYPDLTEPARLTAKIRYGKNAVPATVTAKDGGEADVVFDEPVRAAAPGQSVVFYDGNTVAGGGFIC